MDESQAIHSFWSSFGLDAFDENTVATGNFKPELPYITYTVAVSDFNHNVSMSASIWYYGTSWAQITSKMAEIQSAIGRGGKLLQFDDGAVWIKRGSPFAQRVRDPDDMIRRIYINIEAEFITA